MSSTLGDIKRKVRSLLALAAAGSGGTDPERATARAMANKLMDTHGLREIDAAPQQLHQIRVVINCAEDGRFGFAI